MTLAKQSRKIVCKGVRYQWLVRRRPTKAEVSTERAMHVAVERHDSQGPTLLLTLPHARQGRCFGKYSIWPTDVSRWIGYALNHGWNADGASQVFKLAIPESMLRPEVEQKLHFEGQAPACGDVVAMPMWNGSIGDAFVLAKVLDVDERGVHVRTFKDVVAKADEFVNTSQLILEHGHAAVSHPDWRRAVGEKVGKEDVSENELDAYRQWNRNETGYRGYWITGTDLPEG